MSIRYRYDMAVRSGDAARVWAFVGWCAALSAVAMIAWAVA